MRGRPRGRTRTITRFAKAGKRRAKRASSTTMIMKHAKKAALGGGVGVAIAVGTGLIARQLGMPSLYEAGERLGAVAASALGGTAGQIAFQAVDGAIERVLPQVKNVSGGGIARSSMVLYS